MELVHLIIVRAASLFGRFTREERGAVSVEYLMVFCAVTLGATVATIHLGRTLLGSWGQTQTVLLASKP